MRALVDINTSYGDMLPEGSSMGPMGSSPKSNNPIETPSKPTPF